MTQNSIDIDKLAKSFLEKSQTLPKIRVAAIYPCSEEALKGAIEAAVLGLIDPILIGPKSKIISLAKEYNITLDDYEIIDEPLPQEAVLKGIELVNHKRADSIMKGSLHTDELMKEVVSKSSGLRTNRRISHAFVIAVESYPKPFIVTDAAINISPDLMTKKDIVQNAIDLAHVLKNNYTPKVAIISAVETINPSIPSTIDAACLSKMADRGQIYGAIVDGPFAYDNVISKEAAAIKNIKSPVIGDADILVLPNLEAGNIFVKELIHMSNTISAGIILGAKVPIILTSRADGVRSRIGSCALALMLANAQKAAVP